MSFKINYKGTNCRGTEFLYVCTTCHHEHRESHPASEEPVVDCHDLGCKGVCSKKPTVVSLDADYHDSMKAHNLGWNEDG